MEEQEKSGMRGLLGLSSPSLHAYYECQQKSNSRTTAVIDDARSSAQMHRAFNALANVWMRSIRSLLQPNHGDSVRYKHSAIFVPSHARVDVSIN